MDPSILPPVDIGSARSELKVHQAALLLEGWVGSDSTDPADGDLLALVVLDWAHICEGKVILLTPHTYVRLGLFTDDQGCFINVDGAGEKVVTFSMAAQHISREGHALPELCRCEGVLEEHSPVDQSVIIEMHGRQQLSICSFVLEADLFQFPTVLAGLHDARVVGQVLDVLPPNPCGEPHPLLHQ
jgi:hypothetical protein